MSIFVVIGVTDGQELQEMLRGIGCSWQPAVKHRVSQKDLCTHLMNEIKTLHTSKLARSE